MKKVLNDIKYLSGKRSCGFGATNQEIVDEIMVKNPNLTHEQIKSNSFINTDYDNLTHQEKSNVRRILYTKINSPKRQKTEGPSAPIKPVAGPKSYDVMDTDGKNLLDELNEVDVCNKISELKKEIIDQINLIDELPPEFKNKEINCIKTKSESALTGCKSTSSRRKQYIIDNFNNNLEEYSNEKLISKYRLEQEKASKKTAAEKATAEKAAEQKLKDKTFDTVTLDLYRIFLENYGFTKSYNEDIQNIQILNYAKLLWGDGITDDIYMKKQLKWYCCFAIMFYLDQLHDFTDSTRAKINEPKEDVFKMMNSKLHQNFIEIFNENGYHIVDVENYFKLLNEIFENQGIEVENKDNPKIFFNTEKNCTIIDTEYLGHGFKNIEGKKYTNCESMIYNKLLNPKISKIPRSQDDIQLASEYCLAIMGISRIDFKKLKRTIFNSTNSRYNDQLLKFILYYNNHTNSDDNIIEYINNDFIINGFNNPTNYAISVDALGSPAKTNPLTSILNSFVDFENTYIGKDDAPRENEGRKIYYFSSFADQIDAASTKNILKNTYDRYKEGEYKNRSGFTYEDSAEHIENVENTRFILNFSGNNIIIKNIMDFSFSKNNLLQVNKFFSIDSSGIPLLSSGFINITKLRDIKGQISLPKVVEQMNKSSDMNEKIYWSTYKTVLDFSKTVYFWKFINKNLIVNDPSYNTLMIYNDITASDKSALFIPSSTLIESAENYGEFFDNDLKFYLRSYQLRNIWNYKNPSTDPNLRNPVYPYPLTPPYINYPANIGGFGKKSKKINLILKSINMDIHFLKSMK